ncbi:MAG: YggS family pyridoxal phosphate-dependent enzyme [Epsilonproteobacteria bacterium]|nr:MAG: YggS family pyridoxal phosphate-dependent enzyme [Campylobacterota bacterium]
MTQIEYKIHIDHVIERIEASRIKVNEHHIVKIVAISKYTTPEAIEALYNIGQRAFGENKVQILKVKTEILDALPLEWHFIGNLQKNKINQLLSLNPFLFQALDSIELAHALQQRLETHDNMRLDALMQINSAKEETKSGIAPEMAKDLFDQIREECPNINLKGVMSIGAHTDNAKIIQESFDTTRRLYDSLHNVSICSMGMSGDFEQAIASGSNMVRLGSVMFPHS